MSEQEFDLYLSLLSRFLGLKPAQRAEIADELRDHLEERLEELTRSGLSREAAVRTALDEFGDAAHLAAHFTRIAQIRKRRFIMRLTFGSLAASAAVVFLAMAFWPRMPAGDVPAMAKAQEAADEEIPAPSPVDAAAEPEKPVEAVQEEQPDDGLVVGRHPRDLAVEKKLDEEMDVQFVDTPLRDALDFFKDYLKVKLVVDPRSFEEHQEAESLNALVNLNVLDVPARTVLDLILNENRSAYAVRGGVVHVRCIATHEKDLEVRIYNCRDILQRAEDSRKYTSESAVQSLIQVITNATSGDWKNDCSSGIPQQEQRRDDEGTVTTFDGLLTVRHNQTVHREIEKILEMLRVANANEIAAGAGTQKTPHGEPVPANAEPQTFEPVRIEKDDAL